MEAIRSSETSIHTRSTQRHIPEGGILQEKKKLKSTLQKRGCELDSCGQASGSFE
jgi:hypothetical protein